MQANKQKHKQTNIEAGEAVITSVAFVESYVNVMNFLISGVEVR